MWKRLAISPLLPPGVVTITPQGQHRTSLPDAIALCLKHRFPLRLSRLGTGTVGLQRTKNRIRIATYYEGIVPTVVALKRLFLSFQARGIDNASRLLLCQFRVVCCALCANLVPRRRYAHLGSSLVCHRVLVERVFRPTPFWILEPTESGHILRCLLIGAVPLQKLALVYS